MFSIIGIVVVFGCILAGYLMEHGPLKVLMQPAELIIIGGAAMGTVLISNPVHTLKQMISGLLGVFGSSKFNTKFYTDSLKMMYELLQKARKEGLVHHEANGARIGAQHDGGLPAGPGNCRRRARRGDHHGGARRTSRRDWEKSSGGVGGNLSGHSAVLRIGGTAGRAHGKDGRGGARVSDGVAR